MERRCSLTMWRWALYLLLCSVWCIEGTVNVIEKPRYKPCQGTMAGLSTRGTSDEMYEHYVSRYNNCTYVDGNLEITYLKKDYDMSFLSHIEEVSGYVLLVGNHVSEISLTRLRIIRGRSLYKFKDSYYSLYVAINFEINNGGTPSVGLKELSFHSLYEIMHGNVMLLNNNMMCFENTINWRDILVGEGANVTHVMAGESNRTTCTQECHDSCFMDGAKHCWGAGPNKCQKLTRLVCSPQCDGSCFNRTSQDCCHAECVGGCSGPRSTDCWACKNFRNEGKCVADCPKTVIYDSDKYIYVTNPDGKFSYGSECVSECPDFMLADDAACVRDCGFGKVQSSDGKTCESCEGHCPKECDGTTSFNPDLAYVNSRNIDQFSGCTIIKGGLSILEATFIGDDHYNISGLDPARLSVFESVTEITGFLQIEGFDLDSFTDLSMFRNLRSIKGRVLTDRFDLALSIMRTGLKELGLSSLKGIEDGRGMIMNNPELCLNVNLTALGDGPYRLLSNKNKTACNAEGAVCDPQCTRDGCWGRGNRQCLSCLNFSYNQTCVEECSVIPGAYLGKNNTCEKCHVECLDSCSGPSNGDCFHCKNVKDGPYCVPSCPSEKYPDANNTCLRCHPSCAEGCTGPRNAIGPGACNDCDIRVMREDLPSEPTDADVESCLSEDEERQCEDSYFLQNIHIFNPHANTSSTKSVCKRCNRKCKTCTNNADNCITCVHYMQGSYCVPNCSSGHYPNNAESRCYPCHESCKKCMGPTSMHCISCNHRKILYADGQQFNCTDDCPAHLPHTTVQDTIHGKDYICVSDEEYLALTGSDNRLPTGAIGGIVAVAVFVVLGVVLFIVFLRRSQNSRTLEKFTLRMLQQEETEPLTPTKAKPDMAMLRLIKESELRRGNIIGSGAFGTVYKGVWIPDGENVKIPVAIKVLQEGTPNQNKELLEEARIMTSVDHTCCIRILAVCMTAQMMLITQLMPLGCLLDYVRKNKSNIGSKVLLNWCTQIAKGMAYLEDRGIVHRDLAARNVLVQSSNQVRITDFGLAKLLDYNEGEFHAAGGKMPIKWLALECIHNKVFTHKSDVWSFGVTIWELFTFGQRPYESVRARDIPDLLEKGERLPQPSICTIDVYMIMIKCWMLDAESRPSFKELEDEFAKMARDPGRYLVIQGDKLLRLPSQTYDTKDLVRNMSVAADGPEEIIEADEYLQPQAFLNCKIPPPNIQPTLVPHNYKLDKVQEDGTYDDSRNCSSNTTPLITPPTDHHPNLTPTRELKHSGLESAAAAQRQRQQKKEAPCARDSISTRYSSDPCKVIGAGGVIPEDVPHMPAPPTPLGMPPAHADFKLGAEMHLPVDEDDYLQPKSSNPVAYMDLVGDNPDDLTGDKHETEPIDSTYLDMKLGHALDNPEYFDTNRNMDIHVGYPPGRVSEKSPLTQHSMDRESSRPGADYYNEFEHLNGGRKPPGLYSESRTESTV